MTSNDKTYRHTQRSPLYLLLYALAVTLIVVGVSLRKEPPIHWTFPIVGLLVLVLAASFHYLTVRDQGETLLVSFGPLPLFRRTIRYVDVMSAEAGRTTIFDGWGIHMSLNGGWVWNIWGRDCVILHLKNGGTLRLGTDDTANLVHFLANRCGEKQ